MTVLRKRAPQDMLVSNGNDPKKTLADTLKTVDASAARVAELTPATKATYSTVGADLAAVLVDLGFMAPE